MAEQNTSAPRPSNSPVIFVIVAVALAGLVGLNVMSNQMRPKTEQEQEAEQKAQSSPAASATPAAAPVPEGAPGDVSVADPNSLVLAGQGTVSGAPSAKQEVVVGFSWTPQVQSDPSKVSKAVEALQKSLGSEARIKVVNVDETPDVPEGVSIGGKVIVPAQSDGVIDPGAAETVKKALATAP